MTVRTAFIIGTAKVMVWNGIVCVAFALFLALYSYIADITYSTMALAILLGGLLCGSVGAVVLAFTPDR